MDFGNQYLEYCKEIWGRQVIQEPWGFATYDIKGPLVYIADMYIAPEARAVGRGKELEAEIIEIGLDAGCTFVMCKVHKTDLNWARNLKIYVEHCGYGVHQENDDFISLIKDIGDQL